MRWLRAAAAAVATGILVAVLTHVLAGIPLLWAIALAVPAAAVVALGISTPRAVEPIWQALPHLPSSASNMQASTTASRLAEAYDDPQRFRARIQPRLAALATAKLRQLPGSTDLTSLADPRAAELLGTELHRLLTDTGATLPGPAAVNQLLRRLEEL